MSEELVVLLGDRIAGRLEHTRRAGLRFEYDDEYRRRPDATPLSVSMPVEVGSHPDRVVTPWLWGLLPEDPVVLARWAREFHASATSPFSILSTPVGRDCAGAVRFAAATEADELAADRGRVRWLGEADVSRRLEELKEDATAWLGRTFVGQFSLAGAQAKTALLRRGRRWGVPSGGIPTSHILKPAVAGLDDHDLNEHLCLDAARRAGLVAVRSRVMRFDGASAIVIDRYDRRAAGRQLVRIHQEDLCQALSVHPSRKYESEGGPGAREIARLLRETMPPTAADDAVRRFVDALAWNWVIGGTDAHAKNYSILLSGKDVRLAPMYDVASALPYGADERKLRFAMRLGGRYDVYVRRDPWPKVAVELGLDVDVTVARVRALVERAPEAFADAAREPDVTRLRRRMAARLVDLVATRAAKCAQVLA